MSGAAPTARSSRPPPAPGTAADPITYTYQWERCDADGTNCQVIAGATNPTYTLADADAGQTVRVVVTGTNAGGVEMRPARRLTSRRHPPVNDAAPALSGSAVDGQTLTAPTIGDWSGTDTLITAYQWRRCDAAGAGCDRHLRCDAATYTLAGPDIDGTVRAVVTVTNAYGTRDATAAPSDLVAAALPVITIDPPSSAPPSTARP